MPDLSYSQLERAYLRAVAGKIPPRVGMASGAILNSLLDTDDFDPVETYWLDEFGCYPMLAAEKRELGLSLSGHA
jgi:hypothetical protein